MATLKYCLSLILLISFFQASWAHNKIHASPPPNTPPYCTPCPCMTTPPGTTSPSTTPPSSTPPSTTPPSSTPPTTTPPTSPNTTPPSTKTPSTTPSSTTPPSTTTPGTTTPGTTPPNTKTPGTTPPSTTTPSTTPPSTTPPNTKTPSTTPPSTTTPSTTPPSTTTPSTTPPSTKTPSTTPPSTTPPSTTPSSTTPPSTKTPSTTPPSTTTPSTTPPSTTIPSTTPPSTTTPSTPTPSTTTPSTTPPSTTTPSTTPPSTTPPSTTTPSTTLPSTSTPSTTPPSTTTPSTPPPSTANPNTQITYHGSFSMVFAFGDSYTDTGNANYLGCLKKFANALISHTYYGSTIKEPSSRLCDGRLVIDFLTNALGLPQLPPYKSPSLNTSCGVNFAVSGSTSLSSNYFTRIGGGSNLMWTGIPESFQTQINWFTKFILEKTQKGTSVSSYKSVTANSLFWIGEMGLDDYIRTCGSSISSTWLTELSVDHVCKLLKIMLDNGAKYIVVQGLPSAGCLPATLSSGTASDRDKYGCSNRTNSVIQAHNELLQKRIEEFQKQHSGCMILYADYYAAYQAILSSPEKYGFQEPFKACCGCGSGPYNFKFRSLCGTPASSKCQDPSKHMVWDGVHLTEAMHAKLADLFLNQGFCRPSFSDLIAHKKQFGNP